MVKVQDLWVGDLLQLKRSKRVGTFEGLKNGKIKVKCQDKVVLTSASNVELVEDTFTPSRQVLVEDHETAKAAPILPLVEIDLHIVTLNPAMQHARPERILAIQVAAATEFLNAAKSHKLPSVRIIHGKGKGVLKAEIEHLISMEPAVSNSYVINGGGGVEVLFR